MVLAAEDPDLVAVAVDASPLRERDGLELCSSGGDLAGGSPLLFVWLWLPINHAYLDEFGRVQWRLTVARYGEDLKLCRFGDRGLRLLTGQRKCLQLFISLWHIHGVAALLRVQEHRAEAHARR
jgi:hypothetical protein